jgi:hypothetical protein
MNRLPCSASTGPYGFGERPTDIAHPTRKAGSRESVAGVAYVRAASTTAVHATISGAGS